MTRDRERQRPDEGDSTPPSLFAQPVSRLRAADAVRIVGSADELPGVIGTVLADTALAESLGNRARRVVSEHLCATRRTAETIAKLVPTA